MLPNITYKKEARCLCIDKYYFKSILIEAQICTNVIYSDSLSPYRLRMYGLMVK